MTIGALKVKSKKQLEIYSSARNIKCSHFKLFEIDSLKKMLQKLNLKAVSTCIKILVRIAGFIRFDERDLKKGLFPSKFHQIIEFYEES